jgi:predicted transcriptional regulator
MYAQMVKDLVDTAGLSEKEIAARVASSQPTIHRIKAGHKKFDVGVGDRLRQLHSRMIAAAPIAAVPNAASPEPVAMQEAA